MCWKPTYERASAVTPRPHPPTATPTRQSGNVHANIAACPTKRTDRCHSRAYGALTLCLCPTDIRREFGVSYRPSHVSRLLGKLWLSLQKPERRADQRDEEAIEHGKEQHWPSSKKVTDGWENSRVL
jgi:transposase